MHLPSTTSKSLFILINTHLQANPQNLHNNIPQNVQKSQPSSPSSLSLTISNPLQIAFTVSGTVQGVNFRYSFPSFTAEKANSLSVTGFVQNASDGTVVGEAQGSSSNLDKFVQHLNMGPRAAKVSNVEQKDIGSKEGESKFDQR
ncbi:Acylphosphatase [Pseudocercospora fuligena]|uniref:Acylphosphatase n=1 Tax=Pseudocercospora fuligena TaxID=685502 RepID=A0A8H6RW66_9PEZI|nr:Acylphosphatase [Pseudocercospora fuligena]